MSALKVVHKVKIMPWSMFNFGQNFWNLGEPMQQLAQSALVPNLDQSCPKWSEATDFLRSSYARDPLDFRTT